MNLLFFCFALLALQVLLIEGPQKRANRRRTGKPKPRKTSQPKSTSGQQGVGGQPQSIYGKSFQKEIIAYLTEDNDPVYFGARNLRNGRRGRDDSKEATKVQPQPDWKYSPEVYWGLKTLEAFATLRVTFKDQKDIEYYYPPNSNNFGFTDTTFKKVPGIHQLTAMLTAKDEPNWQICCSVFVRILRIADIGINYAFCGHPICYAATKGMMFKNSKQWTCRPPPIRAQPAAKWTLGMCKKLIISENKN